VRKRSRESRVTKGWSSAELEHHQRADEVPLHLLDDEHRDRHPGDDEERPHEDERGEGHQFEQSQRPGENPAAVQAAGELTEELLRLRTEEFDVQPRRLLHLRLPTLQSGEDPREVGGELAAMPAGACRECGGRGGAMESLELSGRWRESSEVRYEERCGCRRRGSDRKGRFVVPHGHSAAAPFAMDPSGFRF